MPVCSSTAARKSGATRSLPLCLGQRVGFRGSGPSPATKLLLQLFNLAVKLPFHVQPVTLVTTAWPRHSHLAPMCAVPK